MARSWVVWHWLCGIAGTYVCTGISFENQGGRIPGGLTGGSIQLSQLITYIRVTNEQKT